MNETKFCEFCDAEARWIADEFDDPPVYLCQTCHDAFELGQNNFWVVPKELPAGEEV